MAGELIGYEQEEGPGRTNAETAAVPPAGVGELLRAVMALTVAGLRARAVLAARPGNGGGRAAHLG
ncbi:hypothetical protein OG242_06305 [Streptomyces sp. NBC_00727]|uniref:hypothetical protein n=1 Tax=Streptomyces sp. NBC_00727 TaxID=2903675 RepID=UPI00386864E3